MYTIEQLSRYPFFADKLKKTGIQHMLDPLTGLVSRAYILDFARELIQENTPFTFGILDLDNFKFINDTFGHPAGDGVLADVAVHLSSYLEGFGVAGRFGGDEFLFINFRDLKYEEKKSFLIDLYLNSETLRKNVKLEGYSPFITGTVGCATFPEDADSFEELFSLIDKTLYRGKTKGRNCYIIYVEAKHKNIEIRKLARKGMFSIMHSMIRQFEMVPGLRNRLQSVTPLLMEELQIFDLYYAGKNRILRSVRDQTLAEPVPDIAEAFSSDVLYTTNDLEQMKTVCPVSYQTLVKMETETVMMTEVRIDANEAYGYLICAQSRSRRIWQQDECAILYFLSKMVAAHIRINGDSLDE